MNKIKCLVPATLCPQMRTIHVQFIKVSNLLNATRVGYSKLG